MTGDSLALKFSLHHCSAYEHEIMHKIELLLSLLHTLPDQLPFSSTYLSFHSQALFILLWYSV